MNYYYLVPRKRASQGASDAFWRVEVTLICLAPPFKDAHKRGPSRTSLIGFSRQAANTTNTLLSLGETKAITSGLPIRGHGSSGALAAPWVSGTSEARPRAPGAENIHFIVHVSSRDKFMWQINVSFRRQPLIA